MATTQPSAQISTNVQLGSIKIAVKSLLKWQKNSPISKTLNPNSPNFIYLVLTLIEIHPDYRNPNPPIRIPLPHPLISPHSPTFRICLLVKDKYSLQSKQKIESDNLPISNVIKLSKFRSCYNSFDERKKLCDSYDLFLADKGIVSSLGGVIGRCFYKRKKDPIGIELGRSDWREQIEFVCGSVGLELSKGSGCCSVVKVGRDDMSVGEIVENVSCAVEGIARVVPKKWENVRSFHLKFPESLALPIYERSGGSDGEGRKRRKSEDEGELEMGEKRKVKKMAKMK